MIAVWMPSSDSHFSSISTLEDSGSSAWAVTSMCPVRSSVSVGRRAVSIEEMRPPSFQDGFQPNVLPSVGSLETTS